MAVSKCRGLEASSSVCMAFALNRGLSGGTPASELHRGLFPWPPDGVGCGEPPPEPVTPTPTP